MSKNYERKTEMKRKKGYFSISAVAKMFSVHQQTIRLYEKEGLLTPKRSSGNTRLFSEEDVDKLEQIIYLTHELGINLAGVEMVLRLQKQIKKLQKEMNIAFAATQKELTKEEEVYKTVAKQSAHRLVALKQQQKKDMPSSSLESSSTEVEPWHIDYEE